MNRIIQTLSPSFPWLWTAVISGGANQGNVLKDAAKVASIGAQILEGDFSGLVSGISSAMMGADGMVSSLIKSVDLPRTGFTLQYDDMSFVRYPQASQAITEPVNVDFLETDSGLISKYFLTWQNEISPVVGKINHKMKVDDLFQAGEKTTLYKPLISVSRALYIIKFRRDFLTAAAEYLANAYRSTGNDMVEGLRSIMGNIDTGMYELPVQVYCYPHVIPGVFKEIKLDKAETNSIRTISVTFERVPYLRYPSLGPMEYGGGVTKAQLFMSGMLGVSRAASTISGTVISMVESSVKIYTKGMEFSSVLNRQKLSQLASLKAQPEAEPADEGPVDEEPIDEESGV
jgi:hypothetical protein